MTGCPAPVKREKRRNKKMERTAVSERMTKETQIRVKIDLDGSGSGKIDTGIGFFDHMLDGFARHGLFDLDITCRGDLHVDCHHTVEDTGIVLGEAVARALGDKKSICRYGHCLLPMDETLILCAVDLGGRPYLIFDADFSGEKCGDMDTQMVREFFYAVSYSARMNIHIKKIYGSNDHHIMEGIFKAFARSLRSACEQDPRVGGIPSTKGIL